MTNLLEMIYGNQAKKEIERELCGGCKYINESIYGQRCWDCHNHPFRQRKEAETITPIKTQEEVSTTNKGGSVETAPCPNHCICVVCTMKGTPDCPREKNKSDLGRVSEALERALEAMK
jgi:hypothetical protein